MGWPLLEGNWQPDLLFVLKQEQDGCLDTKRRNPQSVEWRAEAGELLYGACYDYEIDANRNWTRRVIWGADHAVRVVAKISRAGRAPRL